MPDEVTRWFANGDDVGIELDVDWESVGRFAPTPLLVEERRAFASGSVLRAARYAPRDLTLVLGVVGDTDTLPGLIRSLIRALDPLRGDGVLRVTRTDGVARDLVCRVISGLEGVEQLGDNSGPEHQRFQVTFHAYDPFWYDVADTEVVVWDYDVGSSLQTTELTIDSDVEEGVWPVWSLSGQATNVDLIWNPGGDYEALSLESLSATATDEVRIDTRELVKSVKMTDIGGAVTNLWPNATGHMWRLRPGDNTVNVSVSGAASGTTLTLAYRTRHLSS